jgi:hypothetical protein
MTIPHEEYQQIINNVNSSMCRGCTKIALREGKIVCYFNDNNIGLWNDLLNGWYCDYKEKILGRK